MEFQNYTQSNVSTTLQQHMTRTFVWMFIGLLVTFGVAYFLSLNELMMFRIIYNNPYMPLILLIAQFGVVIALGVRLMKMATGTAKILFIAYSVLTGITFSILPYAYSIGTLATAFATTCIFFGCLAFIGATTKMDLSKIGTICYAGLMAMIIYSLIAWIFHFSTDSYIYSLIGLVLFMGITAWDVQKMKHMYTAYQYDEAMLSKLGIYSAFQLYLDFINIFLYILRLLGNSED